MKIFERLTEKALLIDVTLTGNSFYIMRHKYNPLRWLLGNKKRIPLEKIYITKPGGRNEI